MSSIVAVHPIVASGYLCRVVETSLGHLCGYVTVPPAHPWWGLDYYDEVVVPQEILERPISPDTIGAINAFCALLDGAPNANAFKICYAIDVHGGLTFAQQTDIGWTFGFDCHHSGDAQTPYDEDAYSVYRDYDYVASHVKSLAAQLRTFA